jgi:hypothetical protein
MIRRSSLIASLTSSRPEFSSCGSYLFLNNPKLFLRGFALDMPPGGCYIWKYMFPLFSNLTFINLTFGRRLENGYVKTINRSRRKIVEDMLRIFDTDYDFEPEESIEEFVSFTRALRLPSDLSREAIELSQIAIDIDSATLDKIVESNKRKYGLR